MTLPLFSVICTVRNRVDQIRKCVESVLAQDDPAVEFVVQDGASDDGTLEILREYGDRIRLVSEPDAGAGDGLFRALRRARGDFFGSCMSDEALVPDAVSWARRTFADHADLGGIYGYAEGVDREGTTLARQDAGEFSVEALLTYRQVPSFVASFFRMDSYRQLGLWEYTGGGGELDLWFRFGLRFPVRRFPKLVAYYGLDRSALSNQTAVYQAERGARLEALRRVFHDDPAAEPCRHLEPQAYAGYFLRYAGMFVRNREWNAARESFDNARSHWPDCSPAWLQEGEARLASVESRLRRSMKSSRMKSLVEQVKFPSREACEDTLQFTPDEGERLRRGWLAYTIDQPFNIWKLLPAVGIRRVALFGGEGWGFALHRQLASGCVTCAAVIENNASTREAAMIDAPYYSLPAYLASGIQVDAVLSSLQGDHDRQVLGGLQTQIGSATPVLSWKTLFALVSEERRHVYGNAGRRTNQFDARQQRQLAGVGSQRQ